jgi:hypothetical protein
VTNRHAPEGRAIVVIRPEHLELDEAPDGEARGDTWRFVRRRFAGSEILLEVEARDGLRVWCEAGPHIRRLRLGDSVTVRLREVETVAFAPIRVAAATPAVEVSVAADRAEDSGGGSEPLEDPLPAPSELPGA